MFEALQDRLGQVFDRLRGRGALTEADVDAALREVRIALLEADVALAVAKDLIATVRARAVGQEVLRSITPGQQVVKIVHDALVEMLGTESTGIDLNAPAPVVILMLGLQGSGKTTSTAKIAKRIQAREKKRVLMASLDTQRPAAQEQLKILGAQAEVATLPVIAGQAPLDIAKRAVTAAKFGNYDVVMLDTAGRLAIDEPLMTEVAAIRDLTRPHETLLVADSLTGQDAVTTAKTFADRIGITGIMLTRVDGDGRGGAALSMRAVTGAPIKLLGAGEKLDALEDFHPRRIAGRILGMGDVVSLVEKAAETVNQEEAEKLAKKMQKGIFDLEDLASQLRQMRKMGGLSSLIGMIPGVGKFRDQIAGANLDDRLIKRQEAIILSMTPQERKTPDVINGSRRKRIARGAGVDVSEVNKLLKMHRQMADLMKQSAKMGKGGLAKLMGQMPPGMMPPGGLPPGFPRR